MQELDKEESGRVAQAETASFRRLRVRRHYRFIFEALLLEAFLSFVYFWFTYVQIQGMEGGGVSLFYFGRYFILRQFPGLALFWIVSLIFLLFVYYGTSFELTPLRLLLAPLRSFTHRFQMADPSDFRERPAPLESLERKSRTAELAGAQEPSSQAAATGDARPLVFGVEAKHETVDHVLHSSATGAAKLADKMERRINTHLILGVLVGLVGLLIWYYSFFIKGANFDKTHIWSEMVPRVSILLFIELLAGFFLQQYRIGVEDLKYFLELQRRANANRIAYAIFDKLKDDEAKRQFAKSLMETRSDTRLQAGETTTALEAIKGSDNVVLKALSILGDH